jgi:pilus assembly protein CpaC
MHRTTRWFGPLAGGILAALLVALPAGRAQDLPRGSAVLVPLNGTLRLQMSTRRPISRVVNPKENALTIRTIVGDPTTVLLVGQQPDVTQVELTDVDGRRETYEVIVQADIEYLRTQLRRAVPTANVNPIPTSNNTVILSGTVTRAEDINVIQSVVQSVGFVSVLNLRVGGVQHVQLDVVLVTVARTDLRSMAFNFLTNSRSWYLGSTVGQAVAEPNVVGVGSPLNATFQGIQALSGIPGAPNGTPTNILTGVLSNKAGFLAFLEALRTENVVKNISEPRLVTLSGRPASFLAGGEQAVPVPAGLGQIGVQFEEFGTRLNFVPVVLGNGKVLLEVEPELSQLNAANGVSINGTVVPGRNTNRIHASVELEAGQTFVIGGLIQNQVTANALKVPVLGDIPFLGAAFSSKSYQETEQEVMVLVTPWLVDGMSCDQRPQVLPGQETRRPDDFELFLEGILEAPRGPRQPYVDHRYVAPYKSSPSVNLMPCAGKGYGPGGDCGNGNGNGNGYGYGNGNPYGFGGAPANGSPATSAPPLAPSSGPVPVQPPARTEEATVPNTNPDAAPQAAAGPAAPGRPADGRTEESAAPGANPDAAPPAPTEAKDRP